MKCSLDAGAIVVAKLADPVRNVAEIGPCHVVIAKLDLLMLEPGSRWPPQIHDDLDQLSEVVTLAQEEDLAGDRFRKDVEQLPDVVGDFMLRLQMGGLLM